MSRDVTRRLRLSLFTRSHSRLFATSSHRALPRNIPKDAANDVGKVISNDFKRRVTQLEQACGGLEKCYPLLHNGSKRRTRVADFNRRYRGLLRHTESDDREVVTIAGRVSSVRTAGNKLVFIDIQQGDDKVQALCQFGKLGASNGTDTDLASFKSFARLIRKGDWYEVHGWPHRTNPGELSILATALPTLLSPSLHQVPDTLDDPETRARNRHVDMLVNPSVIQTLRVRHLVEQHLNDFFARDGFTKVATPLLTAGAGGAVARPFETTATELPDQTLNLRIAPELWLKRLVVGGLEKVYEIGPAFRNESVDMTHNPEFYTCEFYEAFATLDQLMAKTERLLTSMSQLIGQNREESLSSLQASKVDFHTPFQKLAFIPTIEQEMGESLPDLDHPQAYDQLLSLFDKKNIEVPANPSLPRLLDALAAHYIEPLCQSPTFITYHPACLSPLSKHTICPLTGQKISLRAELFIAGREYANMYEEENDPVAQRRKFEDQIAYRRIDGEYDGRAEVDESYLEALEWGLPPTGGWGCGIDRLVMLFAGRDRMADVLAFGSLRNVVGLRRR